jgi:hypothetical protein
MRRHLKVVKNGTGSDASRSGAKVTAIGRLLYPESYDRPKTRTECPIVRPCPWVGCRYNLYLDLNKSGTLRVPTWEPWEQDPAASCTFDVRFKTLNEVGNILGTTRERVRQIEAIALEKLRRGTDPRESKG